MNVAIVIDGVLRQPHGGGPIPAGIGLYRGLCEADRVMLLSTNREDDDRWLYEEGLSMFTLLKQIDVRDMADGTLTNTIGQLRTAGPLQLVIGADPAALAHLVQQGITVSAFLSAEFARPHWRPDYDESPNSWDFLVSQVDLQRSLKQHRKPLESE